MSDSPTDGLPENAVFVGVVKYIDGNMERSRPYSKKGPAKGWVTTNRRTYPKIFGEGWVEYAVSWAVLDD